ncbi:MAG: DUF1800 domain-containing protein [SAR202 cluster bacterium]|nr:DUF1800 domain-containing protein [SAR202 cluster bacterium]
MTTDTALMAHLMRRAGFGAPYEELEARAAKGYEAAVEELLDPDAHSVPAVDAFLQYRYHPMTEVPRNGAQAQMGLMYQLLASQRPLESKMALFWHMVFATGDSKVDNANEMLRQMDTFRRMGRGNYRDLLVALSKDPAMIYWLDNNQNHKHAPNENWGRELLELFSMGQGNYTEDDVKVAARAFTGWTVKPKLPRTPFGRFLWDFEYVPQDHDDSEKAFLGHKGRFNGEDIIDIIVRQPATAQFIARHLYNFFVADEVQVPSWKEEPPRDPEAVQAIADVLVRSDYDLTATLRFIFNSDFFKTEKVWFGKVKSPAEVVVGTIRLVGDYKKPKTGVMSLAMETGFQGQALLDPPSVEGWHTGSEWIDTGSLVRRVNFMVDRLSDASMPGVQSIVQRLASEPSLTPDALVDRCLQYLGNLLVEPGTKKELVQHVEGNRRIREEKGVAELLGLIAATREFQFC